MSTRGDIAAAFPFERVLWHCPILNAKFAAEAHSLLTTGLIKFIKQNFKNGFTFVKVLN